MVRGRGGSLAPTTARERKKIQKGDERRMENYLRVKSKGVK